MAELQAALGHVGTGIIQLVTGNSPLGLQPLHHLREFVLGFARHIHDDLRAQLLQKRQLFGDEPFEADIGQADGIEHTGRQFGDARLRIADAHFRGDGFGHDRPKLVDIHQFAGLLAVTEGARRHKHGILKFHAGNGDL